MDPKQAFVELVNHNDFAVDISGWFLSGGGIRHAMKPGTVLAPGMSLVVVKDPRSFRSRAVSPRAGQGYLIQGSFKGKLDLENNSGKKGGGGGGDDDGDGDDDGVGSRDGVAAASLLRDRISGGSGGYPAAAASASAPPVVLTLVAPGQRVAAMAAVRLMSRSGGVAGHALLRGRLDEMMMMPTARTTATTQHLPLNKNDDEGRYRDGSAAAEDDANTIASILVAAEAAAAAAASSSSVSSSAVSSSPAIPSSTSSSSSSSSFDGYASDRAVTCVSPTFSEWGPWGECCTPGAASKCGVFCGEPGASRGRRRDILRMPPMDDRNRLPCLEPTSEVENTCAASPCQPPEPPKRTCTGSEAANTATPPSATVVVGAAGIARNWEDWSWSAALENERGAGTAPGEDDVGVKATLEGGGALALRSSRLPVLDSGVVVSTWMARSQPGQPPPNIDIQLEIDWSGATALKASDISELPRVFGTTLDWDWTEDTRNASSPKNAPPPKSPREVWSEGCYAEVSISAEALRSRGGRNEADPDAVNPWIGMTLQSALATATGSTGTGTGTEGGDASSTSSSSSSPRVIDAPVKVIVQNRATWTTAFYVGRLTLEDSKDVSRRYRRGPPRPSHIITHGHCRIRSMTCMRLN